MLGYLVVCVIMIFFGGIVSKFKNGNKQMVIGFAILLTLFYGLRASTVGSDTIPYINMFIKDGSVPLVELWDYMWKQKSPAYVLCEWIVYQVVPFPQIWLVITSGFFFGMLSRFIYKNSEDPFYSYLLYFLIFGTFQMTGVRQSIAMAVLMVAYEQIKKRSFIRYLFLICIAFLFHKTALVFFPLYFLFRRKVHWYDIAFLFPIIVFTYGFRDAIFDFIKRFTTYYYFENLNHSEPVNYSIMIYSAALLGFVLCLVINKSNRIGMRNLKIRCRPFTETDVSQYNFYTNIMYFACLFMPLVAVNGSIRRIVMYFAVFMIFFIPKGLKVITGKKLQLLFKSVLLLLLLILLLRGTANSSYYYTLCF